MVQQHKREQRKKHKKENRKRRKSDFDDDETPDADRHVPVVDTETGVVLKGEDAPVAHDLDLWLETHPGYELRLHVSC
ncbi:putative global transcription activator SNF2L2 [Acropora cervicornis]|uniref:Global transcription activator SNF2L2 n=1 Tax=Acropora cervicornis TaxID=6130 RepID=A0AAD9PV46_ACRCE|nr:putative global transcription activator SNF2L2 [Acropora cervicornis]